MRQCICICPDGTAVDIHDPGLTFIVRGALYVARTGRLRSRTVDDIPLISLRHIVRLERSVI